MYFICLLPLATKTYFQVNNKWSDEIYNRPKSKTDLTFFTMRPGLPK